MRVLLLVMVVGCTSDPVEISMQRGACATLEGKMFFSTSPHECGLGPNGPASCLWHVAIKANDSFSSTMTWTYSDIEETLTVTCNGLAISSSTPSYGGTFDPAVGTLTWDSVDYAE